MFSLTRVGMKARLFPTVLDPNPIKYNYHVKSDTGLITSKSDA